MMPLLTACPPRALGFNESSFFCRREWADGRTKRLSSLFKVGREDIFDPFHECADSARQIAPMGYN
jgi:hypothetical protein